MAACDVCKLKPESEEQKAKSLILSMAYEINGKYKGKSKKELESISSSIRNENCYEFDDSEVQSVIHYSRKILAVPARRLVLDGLRWLLPPIALIASIYLVLILTK
jgi:hypothetical protein